MTADPQNNPFIKNLASSDKEVRDQALDSLRTYLSAQRQIGELDLLKLWKGLFYCLWMQDKPALQQRLGRDLAGLVNILNTSVVVPFLDAFWTTIAREWGRIEALRMDKYLYLIRQVLNASWKFLAKKKWGNTEAVEGYVQALEKSPLNVKDAKIPNGLRYHVLDIYVDELEKVAGEEIEDVPLETLLEPVRKLRKESMVKAVREAAKECLEDERVKKWRGEEDEKDGDEEMVDDEEEEWGGIED
ncbi:hypothetical protein B0J11DRAFT_132757 [Dendryphion nanum]|uniref:Nucleolar protein NOP52 variant n=1 Tax=Dendryphion nanum TaxID=256645 RepID=A0A9P9IBX9_9PLEO|nr:hypothetical protein B0J11DRAFT_132757 [Dendryphion nanum]